MDWSEEESKSLVAFAVDRVELKARGVSNKVELEAEVELSGKGSAREGSSLKEESASPSILSSDHLGRMMPDEGL